MTDVSCSLHRALDNLLKRFDEQAEKNSCALFGRVSRYSATQFDAPRDVVKQEMDRIENAVGGIPKDLATGEQERVAMYAEQQRQNDSISQLARATTTAIVPEL